MAVTGKSRSVDYQEVVSGDAAVRKSHSVECQQYRRERRSSLRLAARRAQRPHVGQAAGLIVPTISKN